MNESKDRKALREAVEAMELARTGAQVSMEAIDRARTALAQPDPCAALADALRELTAAWSSSSGTRLQQAFVAARAALAAYEGSKE